MKIVVVDTYYGAFLRSHYSADADLADAPYDEQHTALMARLFGTSDFYSRHFRALGHDAVEIVANCLPLQRRWLGSTEGGHRCRATCPSAYSCRRCEGSSSGRSIHAEAGHRLRPGRRMGRSGRTRLARARAASRRPARVTAPPARGRLPLRPAHLIAPEPRRALSLGWDRLRVPPAGFEPGIVDELPHTAPVADVVHVGGYGPIRAERNDLLERVAARVPIEFWGYAVDGLDTDSAIRRRYRGKPGAPRCTTCAPPLGSR